MLLLISVNRLARLSKPLLIIQHWLLLGHNHSAKNVTKGSPYRTTTKINIQPEIRLLHGCEYITLKTHSNPATKWIQAGSCDNREHFQSNLAPLYQSCMGFVYFIQQAWHGFYWQFSQKSSKVFSWRADYHIIGIFLFFKILQLIKFLFQLGSLQLWIRL